MTDRNAEIRDAVGRYDAALKAARRDSLLPASVSSSAPFADLATAEQGVLAAMGADSGPCVAIVGVRAFVATWENPAFDASDEERGPMVLSVIPSDRILIFS